MKRTLVVIVVFMVISLLQARSITAQSTPDGYEITLLNAINAYREQNGCTLLTHAPNYQQEVESWVLQAPAYYQHRQPTPAGEILAHVTDYNPVDQGALEALAWWKGSKDHNAVLVDSGCQTFNGVAIAHAYRTFESGHKGWFWVAELVKVDTPNSPSSNNGMPVVTQKGRLIMNDISPPLGGTVRFDVTLENESDFNVTFKSIFLRIYHHETGQEFKTDLWKGSQDPLVIPAHGTWQFRAYTPPLPKAGAYKLHNIEMEQLKSDGSTAWLPGLYQGNFFVAGMTNYAHRKSVHVHSVKPGGDFDPSNLVDGSMNTYYRSAPYDDQIVEIDLGIPRDINIIMLYWESGYADEFEVAVDNNNCGSNKHDCTWEIVHATTSAKPGRKGTYYIAGHHEDVRWVKIWLKKMAKPWSFGLFEVSVY